MLCDKNKTRARDRYLVASVDGDWCYVKKFTGNQLRSMSYKVRVSECFKVSPTPIPSTTIAHDTDDETEYITHEPTPPAPPEAPEVLTEPDCPRTPPPTAHPMEDVPPDPPSSTPTNSREHPSADVTADHYEPDNEDNTVNITNDPAPRRSSRNRSKTWWMNDTWEYE